MVSANIAYRQTKAVLQQAGIENAAFEADQLFAFVAGNSRFIITNVTEEQAHQLLALAQKRATRYPLQYLLGSWGFMGLELTVGPGVLVPRPETEEVCEAALAQIAIIKAPVILDLCAGSGALALGLQSRKPAANVMAVELDDAAFGYLQRNCAKFKTSWPRVPLAMQADVLTYYNKVAPQSCHLIVSNPPYVTSAEYADLAPELYFEPRIALEEPADGLLFYKCIAKEYKKALKPGGSLVFEIGAGQGAAVQEILQKSGYQGVVVQKDLAGNDRIAMGNVAEE
ncbi:peptide chain release factor N(5)-glutamine methyltransferase [Ruminococcaceae bacterium OttesenSCG-928-A16]|nr:peptide chain release factor N(5)-glutamine methyltransferase [Ruminococcaceae bacterium OttesenSCG-928-A16]